MHADGDWCTEEAWSAAAGFAVADVNLAVVQVVGEVVGGESIVGSGGGRGIAFRELGWLGRLWAGGEACEDDVGNVSVLGCGDFFLVVGRDGGICGKDCGAVRRTVNA